MGRSGDRNAIPGNAISNLSKNPMRLNNVQFGYRNDKPVIDGISAVLAPGRLCALVGPNAAGKSTLLRLMLGQERPTTGSIELHGFPVAEQSPAQRAEQLAYVPQRPATQVAFTVREVVALGRFALRCDAAVIEWAMDACELEAIRNSVMAELSAGQQQRVALARALAQIGGNGAASLTGDPQREAPRFLLLDEPVSAMDLRHMHQTMRLLKNVAADGVGVLAVLHDLNLASAYADDVWLLDGGQLAAAGAWEPVLTPALLWRVYGVDVRIVSRGAEGRPVFAVAGEF